MTGKYCRSVGLRRIERTLVTTLPLGGNLAPEPTGVGGDGTAAFLLQRQSAVDQAVGDLTLDSLRFRRRSHADHSLADPFAFKTGKQGIVAGKRRKSADCE